MPCNYNFRQLAEKINAGVRSAGGTPMEFNTIAISDAETMGTEGMKASLVSREVIADSIELVGRGYKFDAMIALVGCDKTLPGAAMALDVRSGFPNDLHPGQEADVQLTITAPSAPGDYTLTIDLVQEMVVVFRKGK